MVIVTLPLAMLFAFILMEQLRPVGQPDVAGRAGHRHRHDGRRRGGDGGERLPPLAERKAHGEPVDRTAVVLEAAREVANPIAFAILIIIVVFLPLFSLTGLEGKLFKPMAFTITFAMAGSLLLSLTLVPVLAALARARRPDLRLARRAVREVAVPAAGDVEIGDKLPIEGTGAYTSTYSSAAFNGIPPLKTLPHLMTLSGAGRPAPIPVKPNPDDNTLGAFARLRVGLMCHECREDRFEETRPIAAAPFAIRAERSSDVAAREALLDLCFGDDRHTRTCQRLRDGRLPAEGLAFSAVVKGKLVGTVRLWHVSAGGRAALVLGPLAVDPACQKLGIGAR